MSSNLQLDVGHHNRRGGVMAGTSLVNVYIRGRYNVIWWWNFV